MYVCGGVINFFVTYLGDGGGGSKNNIWSDSGRGGGSWKFL